jgi:hypothetical protein
MTSSAFPSDRLALITALAEQAPGQFGRTALMKFAYFLQAVRRVPLGYHFTLFSYGPFDSRVLNDLHYAQVLGGVAVETVYFPQGYGYQVSPGKAAEKLKSKASDFLTKYQKDIDWVVREFGNRSAGELELLSTIIYADRSVPAREKVSLTDLANRVQTVKPHFTLEQVQSYAEWLRKKGLLAAVSK